MRCPGVVTIGRLIADAGGLRTVPPPLDNRGRRKRPRPPKPHKPKGFRARRPGEVLVVDTVTAVRDGARRYLCAYLALRSRFGLAVASPGRSSRWASDFADLAFDQFPRSGGPGIWAPYGRTVLISSVSMSSGPAPPRPNTGERTLLVHCGRSTF